MNKSTLVIIIYILGLIFGGLVVFGIYPYIFKKKEQDLSTFESNLQNIDKAIKDIKKGDELSYDYGFSFDEDFQNYPCRCNAKNCCGYIVRQGSRWRIKKSLSLNK